AAADEADALAAEQTKIAAHDALDAVALLSDERGRNSTARLLESDQRTSFGSALLSWLEGVGAAIAWPTDGTFRIQPRPRPQVPFELDVALSPSTGIELTSDRWIAVERGVPLLRAGHSLVDAIARHLRHDDR